MTISFYRAQGNEHLPVLPRPRPSKTFPNLERLAEGSTTIPFVNYRPSPERIEREAYRHGRPLSRLEDWSTDGWLSLVTCKILDNLIRISSLDGDVGTRSLDKLVGTERDSSLPDHTRQRLIRTCDFLVRSFVRSALSDRPTRIGDPYLNIPERRNACRYYILCPGS